MDKVPHNPGYIERIERIWAEIRSRECFTAGEISRETKIPVETVRGYVNALNKAGYVERIGHEAIELGSGNIQRSRVWTVVRDNGIEAPKYTLDGRPIPPSWREQIWRTIRIVKVFTYRELVVQSRTDEVAPSEKAVRQYIAELLRAGVLVSDDKFPRTYRLVPSKNTGPKPHLRTRKGGVIRLIDQNTGKVIWEAKNG